MHFPNPILTSGPSLFCFLQLVVFGGDTLGFIPPVVGAGAAAHADCTEGASVEEGACAGASAGAGVAMEPVLALVMVLQLLQSKSIWGSMFCQPAQFPHKLHEGTCDNPHKCGGMSLANHPFHRAR